MWWIELAILVVIALWLICLTASAFNRCDEHDDLAGRVRQLPGRVDVLFLQQQLTHLRARVDGQDGQLSKLTAQRRDDQELLFAASESLRALETRGRELADKQRAGFSDAEQQVRALGAALGKEQRFVPDYGPTIIELSPLRFVHAWVDIEPEDIEPEQAPAPPRKAKRRRTRA